MTKKFVLSILVLAVAGGALWTYYSNKDQKLSYEIAADLPIAESSLEGEVVSETNDGVVIKTGRIERTEKGNVLVEYEKSIKFSDKIDFVTKLNPLTIKADVVSMSEALKRLEVGDRAVFYGAGKVDVTLADAFTVTKIELIAKKTVDNSASLR